MDSAQSSRGGVTLIELVIVILIFGITAAIAAPKYQRALASTRVRAGAVLIQSDLRLARNYAKRTAAAQSISFDLLNESYTLPGTVSIDRRGTVQSRTLESVDIIDADFNGSTTVTFNIFGRPSSTGTVLVSAGGISATVAVNSAGDVNIE